MYDAQRARRRDWRIETVDTAGACHVKAAPAIFHDGTGAHARQTLGARVRYKGRLGRTWRADSHGAATRSCPEAPRVVHVELRYPTVRKPGAGGKSRKASIATSIQPARRGHPDVARMVFGKRRYQAGRHLLDLAIALQFACLPLDARETVGCPVSRDPDIAP